MHRNAPTHGRVAGRAAAIALTFVPVLAVVLAAAVPRVPALSSEKPAPVLSSHVSPDGQWLAVACAGRGGVAPRAWIVALDDGAVRTLDQLALVDDQIGWDASSRLRVRVLDRERGLPEMRWIDAQSGQTLETTRDRARMRAELAAGGSWAVIDERKCSDGRVAPSVTWSANGRKLELPPRKDGGCQVGAVPGIVYHAQRSGSGEVLVRHDMHSGASRELAQLERATVSWSLSADGRGVLLVETGNERRARVIDADTGMLLHGPWVVDGARWIEGADGRYLGLTRGSRRTVLDTLRDREADFGVEEGAWPRIVALDDGRFVVDDGARITLCDDDLATQRELFERSTALAVARN